MPAPPHVQAATLERFIQGWMGWTPEGFLATWSEDCTQRTLPFSFDAPIRDRPHVEKFFPILMSYLSNFKLTIHNIVHDTTSGKAVIYALAEADTPSGPYRNEHALFLWFDESGEKVKKIEEMFDTVVMKDILPKINEYVAQLKENGEAKLRT